MHINLSSRKSNKMEEIETDNGKLIAFVIRENFKKQGINFVSKRDFPLQLGINAYKKGSQIKPHFHIEKEIKINKIQEVVHIESGKVIVYLYNLKGKKIKSLNLSWGDTIFFINGGHGFEILENTKIIEVRQGPYMGKSKAKKMIKEIF